MLSLKEKQIIPITNLRQICTSRTFLLTIFVATIALSVFFVGSAVDQVYAAKYPWTAHLSGQNKVPSVESVATATADFKLAENGAIRYRVNVSGISNASAAHIHEGKNGENGDVVADLLHTPRSKDKDTVYGMIFRVTGLNQVLKEPMHGKTIQDLVAAMDAGQINVNMHTSEHPDGEIRGQIINQEKTAGPTNW